MSGTQQGAGYGDALRLPFAEAASLFAERRVDAVGQLRDKSGGLRIAHQQVVADGAAEERVALWHIYEVAAGLRGDGDAARGLYGCELDIPLLRSGECQQQTDKCRLPAPRLADNGGAASGRKGAGETAEYRMLTGKVTEGDVFQLQRRSGGEEDSVSARLGRQLLQFHQSLRGGEGVDERRQQARKVEGRALHFAYQLQECRHGSEGDAACAEADSSPKESGEIAAGER